MVGFSLGCPHYIHVTKCKENMETLFFPRASERRVLQKRGSAVLHLHILRLLMLHLHILRLLILHLHILRLLMLHLHILRLLILHHHISRVNNRDPNRDDIHWFTCQVPMFDLCKVETVGAHVTSSHLTSASLTSSHLTPNHLTSTHLTSAHLTSSLLTSSLLSSCNFSFLFSCSLVLLSSLLRRGRCHREMRLRPFRTKWGSDVKNCGKNCDFVLPTANHGPPPRTKWGSDVKNCGKIAIFCCPREPFRTTWSSDVKD